MHYFLSYYLEIVSNVFVFSQYLGFDLGLITTNLDATFYKSYVTFPFLISSSFFAFSLNYSP